MTTESTSADEATRRDGSRLSEGLGAWRRSEEAMEWQPIETAPKNGTDVLCFRLLRGEPDIATARWKPDAEAFGGPGWCYAPGRHGPTHWMPMPAPPEGA